MKHPNPLSSKLRLRLWLQIAISILLCGACDPGFELPSEIGSSKLLGVRLEVDGVKDRAWPRVGERFTLRWLVARSSEQTDLPLDKQLDAAVSLCVGTQLPTGSLYCAFEIELTAALKDRKPTVASYEEIDIPLELSVDPRAVAGGQRLLLFGGVCVEGKIQRVADKKPGEAPTNELYRCTDNDEAELKTALTFTSTVIVDYTDDKFPENLNPSLACETTDESSICTRGTVHDYEERRGGAVVLVLPRKKGAPKTTKRQVVEWPEVIDNTQPLEFEGCATDPRFDNLKVKVGSDEHLIRVRFDAKDRETYEVEELKLNETMIVTKREELLVSHAATKFGGKLGRYYSVIPREQSDKTAEVELDYTPPAKSDDAEKRVTAAGRLVRFYFVVRDQRGGVDFTTRSLCLVP